MEKRNKKFAIWLVIAVLILGTVFFLKNVVGLNFYWSSLWNVFNKFVGLFIFLIALFIFFESKNPSRTLSWLLILALAPVLGLILYMFLGNDIRKKIKTKNKENLDNTFIRNAALTQTNMINHTDFFTKTESKVDDKLVKLLLKNSNEPFSINNKVDVLTNGEETFSSIIDSIKMAKNYIHLEYFIIRDDEIGNEIKNLLIKKAIEGIRVRIIYDSVGCWKIKEKFWMDLKNAGIEVYPFLPVLSPMLSRELNYRNHRKIVVVDGTVGFLGGLNIGDEYLGKKDLGFWRDTHLKIEGESVFSIQNIFLNDWYFVSKQELKGEYLFPRMDSVGESIVQITSCGPDSDWKTIHQAFFSMITTAEKRVWLTTPYLVPDESLKMALITAALSGIDVSIIIPGKPDHFFVYWASRDNIQEFLEAGVKIYTYETGFIHSKILIVDDVCASVGTANFDIRSLEINYEINAFLYDKKIIERLESDFLNDIENSKNIELNQHMERPFYNKFLEALGRLVSPLQ